MTEVVAQFTLAVQAQQAQAELQVSYSCEVEPWPQGGWALLLSIPEGIWKAADSAYALVLRVITENGGKVVATR